MKAIVREFDGCFSVDIDAENMEEAAVLIRMAMNSVLKFRTLETWVPQGAQISMAIVTPKKKNSTNAVRSR